MKNKFFINIIVISALVGISVAGYCYAATMQGNFGQGGFGDQVQFQGNRQQNPGVFGTVSAINGTNLTIVSKGFGPDSATTTYAVDASNATVEKDRATSTLSVISVGNSVMVLGAINETSITATRINLNAGLGEGDRQNIGKGFNQRNASSTMQKRGASSTNMMEGNGQPIIGGTVSVISDTTITITNKSNTSYTVDASSANITKADKKISVSDIAVGDSVLVQGAINGTSVTAATITDQSFAAHGTSTEKKINDNQKPSGFFRGIGNFFAKLFGF